MDYGKCDGAAVTIGSFDGIHTGHQRLIRAAVDYAKAKGIKSCVFTFESNPSKQRLITDNDTRIRIFKQLGADTVIFNRFDDNFKNLTATEFFNAYLKNARFISVGFNFRFGKDRLGDTELLKELCAKNGVELDIAGPVKYKGETVSSSRIRKAIFDGDFSLAEQMLGREYFIEGVVRHGDRIGTGMGFPTANIDLDSHMVLPEHGVYASKTVFDGVEYNSVTNYGGKPTIKSGINAIETHIINFDGDLYGKKIAVRFIRKIRNIVAFKSAEELKQQIEKDKANC